MAFPIVAGFAYSSQTSNTITSNVALPTPVAPGDLLIVFMAEDIGVGQDTYPANWVELLDTPGTTHARSIAYKIALGGETSIVVVHDGAERSNHISLRISVGTWHGTSAPELGPGSYVDTISPDPPAMSPTWGADENLWIATMFADDSTPPFPIVTWPANYTVGNYSNSTSTSAAAVALATRNLNAATENPGPFTMTMQEQTSAYTIAVRPAGGGGPPPAKSPPFGSRPMQALLGR